MDTSTQIQQGALSCTFCFQIIKEPRVLYCRRSCRFCETCLSGYMVASITTAVDGRLGFPCPGCREFIPTPARGPSGSLNIAYYGKHLLRLHKRYQLPKNDQRVGRPCLEHTNTEVGLYCVDCSQIICYRCVTTSHSKCNRLIAITKAAQYLRSKLHTSLKQVQSMSEDIAERIKVQVSLETEVTKRIALMDKEIKEITQKIVEYQQIQFLNELCQYYNALLANLSGNISTLIEDIRQLYVNLTSAVHYTDIDLCSNTSLNADIDSFRAKYIASNEQFNNLCKKLTAACRFEVNSSPYASLGSILFVSEIRSTNGPDDTALSSSEPTQCSVSMPSGSQNTQGSLSTPVDLIVAKPTQESMSLSTGWRRTQNSAQGSMSRIQTNSAERADTSTFDRVGYSGFPETTADQSFLPSKKRK